jgi:hypothetical protein
MMTFVLLLGAAYLLLEGLGGAGMLGGLGLGRPRHTGRRCNRCAQPSPRLVATIDGRMERWVCPMCIAELDLVRAERLRPPTR